MVGTNISLRRHTAVTDVDGDSYDFVLDINRNVCVGLLHVALQSMLQGLFPAHELDRAPVRELQSESGVEYVS